MKLQCIQFLIVIYIAHETTMYAISHSYLYSP